MRVCFVSAAAAAAAHLLVLFFAALTHRFDERDTTTRLSPALVHDAPVDDRELDTHVAGLHRFDREGVAVKDDQVGELADRESTVVRLSVCRASEVVGMDQANREALPLFS